MNQLFNFEVIDKEIKEIKPTFIVKEFETETIKRIEAFQLEVERIRKKSSGPKWVKNLFYGFFLIGLFLFVVVINALSDISRERLISVVLPIFITSLVFLVISLMLFIYMKHINKKVLTNHVKAEILEKERALFNDLFIEMDIPSSAKRIDVLYESKGPLPKLTFLTKFLTRETLMFIKERSLYIFNFKELLALSLDHITTKEVLKKIQTTGWYKENPPLSSEYKPYKIRTNAYGHIFLKSYYEVRVDKWVFYIPNYDKGPFEAILNNA